MAAFEGFEVEIISTRCYKAGYQVQLERVTSLEDPDHPVLMKSAYTIPEGHYIGDSKMAHRLIVRRGIKPELVSPDHNVCSIGFCEREQKWYGWSHRAISGFGIGFEVTAESDLLHPEFPVGFKAETLDDARRLAVAFAESVS